MADNRKRYRFRIDAFTPSTIPMARLAEYMADLSKLLGTQERVHFVGLESGSTVLVQEVEYEAVPKVKDRINGIKHRSAPVEATDAFRRIDRHLREDNGSGVIEEEVDSGLASVIEFPGRKRDSLEHFDSIYQCGSLDGVLIRVGGRDQTVPIYLEEGSTIHFCNANRTVARSLAPHLFAGVLRVHGNGKWNRDDFGNWMMEKFTINDFTILDVTSLKEAVGKIREIKSPFQSLEDPVAEMEKLRRD